MKSICRVMATLSFVVSTVAYFLHDQQGAIFFALQAIIFSIWEGHSK